jgi:NADH-quinone oxidoreductase subunit A
MVAVIFLIFDVEILFLFPLAIWFMKQPVYGFIALVSFVGVLFIGWFYLVKRGVLEWE